jgi:hypothetical protein
MDARHCQKEIHRYFENGNEKFKRMIDDWGLNESCPSPFSD